MVQETYFDDQKVESPNAEYDAADIASATLGEILGMGTGSPISGFGGGLEMDGNGNLQVNSAYFDGSITGISNPLTANLDAANYDVTNVGALEASDAINFNDLNLGTADSPTEFLDYNGTFEVGTQINETSITADGATQKIAYKGEFSKYLAGKAKIIVYDTSTGDYYYDEIKIINNQPRSSDLTDGNGSLTRSYTFSANYIRLNADGSGQSLDIAVIWTGGAV